MKHLPLTNPNHKRLEKAFKNWLVVTGYAETSSYYLPHHVRELFHWLEQQTLNVSGLTSKQLTNYFTYLQDRTKERRQGFLSTSYLYKHLQAIKQLSVYLRKTGQKSFEIEVNLPEKKYKKTQILTREEIGDLYEACANTPIGQRDKALLAICYGCGLRRTEAMSLDEKDILKEQQLLYVRNGKNNKERYVPLTNSLLGILTNYQNDGRKTLNRNIIEPSLFISERGNRLQGQSLQLRLKYLLKLAEIEKNISLHSLRHSIATHLLQSGMSLEHIAHFLGHQTLEATQLYTHILNEQSQ